MPSRMYSTIQLLEIMRRSAFKSPLSYPSLLGWPLLTVETEVNEDSRVQMKGSFLGWFVGLVVPAQEILDHILSNGNLFTKTIIHNKAEIYMYVFIFWD
jgi:hypothetical protein